MPLSSARSAHSGTIYTSGSDSHGHVIVTRDQKVSRKPASRHSRSPPMKGVTVITGRPFQLDLSPRLATSRPLPKLQLFGRVQSNHLRCSSRRSIRPFTSRCRARSPRKVHRDRQCRTCRPAGNITRRTTSNSSLKQSRSVSKEKCMHLSPANERRMEAASQPKCAAIESSITSFKTLHIDIPPCAEKIYLENRGLLACPVFTSSRQPFLLSMRDNAVSRIENLQIWQQQLVVLDLSHNDIESMNGVERLSNLQALSLSANCIKVMADMRGLRKLQFLDLKRNKISRIEGVAEHPSMRVLCLSENRLSRLSGVTNMPHLVELDLRENQIQMLDPLYGMDQLRRVFLSHNRIERWEGLGGLTMATTVTEVTLDGNPLVRTATFRRFARLGNTEFEKSEFGWPEQALASFVPSTTSVDTIGHRSMAGDANNLLSARSLQSSGRDTNTTATKVEASKPSNTAGLQSIAKGDRSSDSATTIDLEASVCASNVGSPSHLSHSMAQGEPQSENLEPASNNSSPSVNDERSDINSDTEGADEGQSGDQRSSLSRSQLSSCRDTIDQSEGEYKELERSTDGHSDVEDQYTQNEDDEEATKPSRAQEESEDDVDKALRETSKLASEDRSPVSSEPSQELNSPPTQKAPDIKRFCPLLKLADAACLRRLELKCDRKHLVICGGHDIHEVDENSQFIPGPLDFLQNILQKRRNSNTVNLCNIREVTICGFPWRAVVKELSSLRSTMPHLEALTLLDNGLKRMGEITQLIDLKFLKRLTIYAKTPKSPREATDWQDPAVLQCTPKRLSADVSAGYSEDSLSSEDSNLVGNPAVIQAGRYWRPFLIWSLKPTLGLQVLDEKTITADEQEKAMEMFRGYSVAVSTRSRVSFAGFEGARAALLALGFMSTPREVRRHSRHPLASARSTGSSRAETSSYDPLFTDRARGLMTVLDSAHKLASGEGAPYDLCQTLKTLRSTSNDNRGPILEEILRDTLHSTQMRLKRENQLLNRWPKILTDLLTAAAVPREPPELPQL